MKPDVLKSSQFNQLVADYPEKGTHILYNTRTGAMAEIDDEGRCILENLPVTPTDAPVQSWLMSLRDGGFVVPHGRNEGEFYVQQLEKAKLNTEHLHVTLSLIQGCNFGCGYCYQGGESTTHDLSRIQLLKKWKDEQVPEIHTAEVIAFLKSQCASRKVKQLHFTAYGGEPLLNKPALKEIVAGMQAYCQRQNIRWFFDMVSNGSLLNRKTVLELKSLGFAKVQITIDGDKETHDRSRPFRKADGRDISTYDVIMQNLESFAGLIHTDVLSVVSEENLSGVRRLIDILADKGLAQKRVRMRFAPVSPTYDDGNIQRVSANFAENPRLKDAELRTVKAIADLQIYAAKRGLIDDLRPHGTWCSVIRANGQNVTLTPDGNIYSCALFIGRDDKYQTGHIHQPSRGGLDATMKPFVYPDECKKCEYLPICSNCRADALSKTGDIMGANSYKAWYQATVPKLIKAQYELRHHRKSPTANPKRKETPDGTQI